MPSYSALRTLLEEKIELGQPAYINWNIWGSIQTAEAMARGPFSAVLVDMQHGAATFGDVQAMMAVIIQCQSVPLVRIPVGDFATASRAVDAGAQAIVAPMINKPEEAKALVDAVKYPPIGARSFGPLRTNTLYETTDVNRYVCEANQFCLTFAMIETKEALGNLDAILAVEGIDGVFVGPADLSLTLLEGERVDIDDVEVNRIYEEIASKAKDCGLFSGIYAFDSASAERFAGYGYQMVAVGSDMGFFAAGLRQAADDLGLL